MDTKTYKIIAFSDSHEDNNVFEKLLPIINSADYCFFLGDGYRSVLRKEKEIKCEFRCVKGNCDFVPEALTEQVVKIGECEFFLTHGHNYEVKYSLARLSYAAREKKCAFALFGHTHNPVILSDQFLTLINPGSLRYSNNGDSTYALITGDGVTFSTEIKKIN